MENWLDLLRLVGFLTAFNKHIHNLFLINYEWQTYQEAAYFNLKAFSVKTLLTSGYKMLVYHILVKPDTQLVNKDIFQCWQLC